MNDAEKVSVETLPLTKAVMQDLYDKFDAAYAAYNTYRSVVDTADLYMPHLEINPQQRPWVGLTKETMLFIIAKHTHLKMRYHEDETTVIDEHVEAEQLVREVEAWLKEKNNAV